MDAFIGFLGAIIGAIVGGFLAGHYSRQATKDLLDEERRKSEVEKDEQVKALLRALKNEVRSVWTHYMDDTGKHLESLPKESRCRFYFPIIGDYFPIYAGNVSSLGLITDVILQHQIISTYTLAKSLIDTYRLNNQLNKEVDDAVSQSFYLNSPRADQAQKVKEQILDSYAPALKLLHVKTKNAVEELLEILDTATIDPKSPIV
jgi:gas vesicle protein